MILSQAIKTESYTGIGERREVTINVRFVYLTFCLLNIIRFIITLRKIIILPGVDVGVGVLLPSSLPLYQRKTHTRGNIWSFTVG